MKTHILAVAMVLTAILAGVSVRAESPKRAYPAPKEEYGVFYGQRASLFNLLPVDSTDIVMLGNSLTNGCEWHELLGKPNVKNRGINGDIVAGVADRIGPIIDGQPAKVFVLTGVNDVSHHLSAEEIADQYAALLDTMRAQMPNTRIYVQSCLPINIVFDRYKVMIGKDQVIRDFNALLAKIAEEKGCTWIDLYPLFADEEGHMRLEYTNDGLHLLGPGYLVWRDAILPYINE